MAGYGVSAIVDVARAIDRTEITYSGSIDAEGVLETFHPSRMATNDTGPSDRVPTYAYLSDAAGTVTDPSPRPGHIAWWAAIRLLPWLLALAVLLLLAPVLRAAERGDPFGGDMTGRLTRVGSLLFFGIPLIAVLEWMLTEGASPGTEGAIAPAVTADLTLGVAHFLPGALVLALAVVFAKGAELRDLERHTV